MRDKVYRGAETNEISFPLGGIGTGCIGLAGNGRLIDWEIQNRPNKGSVNGFSHLAIRAERAGKVLDARVLNGDLPAPYSGSFTGGKYASFGFGPPREALAGVPHFREAVFHGLYPLARVEFADPTFPGQVTLDAYNPFIPLNDRDSSIPAAFLEVGVQNPTDEPLSYAVCLAVLNPLRAGVPFSRYEERDALKFMHLSAQGLAADDPTAGGVVIATDAERVSYQESWFRGAWFDNLTIYWRDLNTPGPFRNRTYAADPADRQAARGDHGLLAAHIDVAPGETRRVRYVISWSFPNRVNDWNPRACECATAGCAPAAEWRNHYATLFADARDSAAYALCEWDRLYAETERFQQTLCSSTVPDEVIDAVTANLSVLKSPTCLRLEDGTFYGFEGCHVCEGCCEGSCMHVWNYAQALPYLYPALERSMRDADFVHNMGEDGGMGFRLQLPLGRERSSFRPCVDGQFGGIIKAYRDWKISGDTDWLRRHWTAMKKMISYAWAETNPDGWDRDRDGVLEGRQHHTLDMELF
ncbi:MAG: hypothetical protein GX557_14090, partial [Chloroflexi bacterium]|nr:hypothetical protein [Chloroflexota bacterium]